MKLANNMDKTCAGVETEHPSDLLEDSALISQFSCLLIVTVNSFTQSNWIAQFFCQYCN
jgi:hypothetical protein